MPSQLPNQLFAETCTGSFPMKNCMHVLALCSRSETVRFDTCKVGTSTRLTTTAHNTKQTMQTTPSGASHTDG